MVIEQWPNPVNQEIIVGNMLINGYPA